MVGSYLIDQALAVMKYQIVEKGQKSDRLTQTSIDFVLAAV